MNLVLCPNLSSHKWAQLKKAFKALCLSAFFVPVVSANNQNTCHYSGPPEGARPVEVARVQDGDSLYLRDGRKVRLVGVNTPELGRKGRAAEPFADEARRELHRLVSRYSDWYLLPGVEQQDRYGRQLGQVVSSSGVNAGAYLVERGLALVVAKAPNDRQAPCYLQLEKTAAGKQSGLWGNPYWLPASASHASRLGFQLLRGRVTRVDTASNGDVWLELDDALVVRLTGSAAVSVLKYRRDIMEGADVQVRGWLARR